MAQPNSNIPQDEKKYIFDHPSSLKILLRCLYVVLAVLFCMDFFVEKHPHFPYESWFGFYAIYGFVTCVLLVLAARYLLRPLVMKDEKFYD